jgi:hypothetical protein
MMRGDFVTIAKDLRILDTQPPRAGRCARIGSLKMSKEEIPTPKGLWESLLDIDPNHFNGGYPDIGMLGAYFQKYSNRDESQTAKLSFRKAIDSWNEEQIREFVYLLTESQVSSASSEELRKILIKV